MAVTVGDGGAVELWDISAEDRGMGAAGVAAGALGERGPGRGVGRRRDTVHRVPGRDAHHLGPHRHQRLRRDVRQPGGPADLEPDPGRRPRAGRGGAGTHAFRHGSGCRKRRRAVPRPEVRSRDRPRPGQPRNGALRIRDRPSRSARTDDSWRSPMGSEPPSSTREPGRSSTGSCCRPTNRRRDRPAMGVWCSAWTPDGSRLLLCAERGENDETTRRSTSSWSTPRPGDRSARSTSPREAQVLEWSPDHSVLAVGLLARRRESGLLDRDLDVVRTARARRRGPSTSPGPRTAAGSRSAAPRGRSRSSTRRPGVWSTGRPSSSARSITDVEWLPDGDTVVASGDGRRRRDVRRRPRHRPGRLDAGHGHPRRRIRLPDARTDRRGARPRRPAPRITATRWTRRSGWPGPARSRAAT